MRDSDVCAEVTRSLFTRARQYRESFDAYGSKKSFEWQQVEGEEPVIHTKSTPAHPLTEARDSAAGQGARLRQPPARADPPVHAAGGHSGRRAPVVPAGRRPRRVAPAPGAQFPDGLCSGQEAPMPDAETSANWTMVGICAHQSALKGGEKIDPASRSPLTAMATALGPRIRTGTR